MKKYLSKALAATSTALLLGCLSACGGANEADTSRIAALEQSLSALESEKTRLQRNATAITVCIRTLKDSSPPCRKPRASFQSAGKTWRASPI